MAQEAALEDNRVCRWVRLSIEGSLVGWGHLSEET